MKKFATEMNAFMEVEKIPTAGMDVPTTLDFHDFRRTGAETQNLCISSDLVNRSLSTGK